MTKMVSLNNCTHNDDYGKNENKFEKIYGLLKHFHFFDGKGFGHGYDNFCKIRYSVFTDSWHSENDKCAAREREDLPQCVCP
jgi:hypothetical protein